MGWERRIQQITGKIENAAAVGRPKSYTAEQVSDVVETMLKEGCPPAEIDAKTVKPRLCDRYKISTGIRVEGLEDMVAAILSARAKEEELALLTALPSEVASAVDLVLSAVRKDLLLLVARQYSACRKAAEQDCEELRADKRAAHWRIAELEAQARDQAAEIKEVVRERDAAVADRSAARARISILEAELEKMGQETATIDRILAELRNPDVRNDLRAVILDIAKNPDEAMRPS